MSFKEDHERWQDAARKVLSIRQLAGEMALIDFNVVLDELNSLDYSTRLIQGNEASVGNMRIAAAWTVLYSTSQKCFRYIVILLQL